MVTRSIRQQWVVRVVNGAGTRGDALNNRLSIIWVEQFRYMGLLREVAEHENYNVIEFACPDPLMDSRAWAQQNAERMRSFGIQAVAVPRQL